MRLKPFILLPLVFVVLVYWFLYHQPTSEPAKTPQPKLQTKTQTVEQLKLNPTVKTQTPPETNSVDFDQWEQQILKQLAEPRYSEDLVVEMISLGFEYEGCGNQDTDWFFGNMSINNIQDSIKKQAADHCDELAKKYPFLSENIISLNTNIGALNFFPATTKLGKYIQKQRQSGGITDAFQHQQSLISLAIQAGNAQILMLVELMSGFGQQDKNLMQEVLNNANPKYFKTINSMALTSLSCQFNDAITCSPSAKFMAHKCYAQDQFCGLNFKQWFEKSVTPGVARDVELLKQRYLTEAEL